MSDESENGISQHKNAHKISDVQLINHAVRFILFYGKLYCLYSFIIWPTKIYLMGQISHTFSMGQQCNYNSL